MGPACTCGTHGALATGPCTRVLGTRPALGGSAVNKIEILFCNKIEIHRHKLVAMQSGPALRCMGPTRAVRVPTSSMLPSLIKMRVVAQGASHAPPPPPTSLSLYEVLQVMSLRVVEQATRRPPVAQIECVLLLSCTTKRIFFGNPSKNTFSSAE